MAHKKTTLASKLDKQKAKELEVQSSDQEEEEDYKFSGSNTDS